MWGACPPPGCTATSKSEKAPPVRAPPTLRVSSCAPDIRTAKPSPGPRSTAPPRSRASMVCRLPSCSASVCPHCAARGGREPRTPPTRRPHERESVGRCAAGAARCILEVVGKRDTSNETPGREAPSFGAHLRRLREAAGLSQEELAFRAGLSPNAVGTIERGVRKRPQPHTVRSLADALGLAGQERTALLAAVPARVDAAPPDRRVAKTYELPHPATPLVGRERELEEVSGLLARPEVRLLTLTGIGGVGKTRLALEAARETAERFPDGARFVSLASLSNATLVVPTVARSLGLRESECQTPREALHTLLRGKRLLLMLDNFE